MYVPWVQVAWDYQVSSSTWSIMCSCSIQRMFHHHIHDTFRSSDHCTNQLRILAPLRLHHGSIRGTLSSQFASLGANHNLGISHRRCNSSGCLSLHYFFYLITWFCPTYLSWDCTTTRRRITSNLENLHTVVPIYRIWLLPYWIALFCQVWRLSWHTADSRALCPCGRPTSHWSFPLL